MKSVIPLNNNNSIANGNISLRYILLVPLVLMIATFISCCFSYSYAKECITNELNDAMLAVVNENGELWTQPDTIAALRHIHKTTQKPLIFQASDTYFKNTALKGNAYITVALIDPKKSIPKIRENYIASDSIMIVPQRSIDGLAIQIQGFADCSMASIFAVSDKSLPGILFTLSMLSMASIIIWRRRSREYAGTSLLATPPAIPSFDGILLTPMQRQFTQMLAQAPEMRVNKKTLCEALWGNKSNAEESLYTLVRRTKNALANTNMEILCNRGESYELRINT